MTDGSLVVYSDYVCPFCFLGKQSLDRYRESVASPPPVEWRPFDLRANRRDPDGAIDHSIDDGKDDAYFEQVRENVERLADEYDVDLAIPHARDVDSRPAQAAGLVVRDRWPDRFDAFHVRVFDALWLEGRDIDDPGVLGSIADEVGAPGGELRDTLDDEATMQRLEAAFRAARDAGVTAVPTFAYGEHAARGAVPPGQLRRLVEGT